MAARTIPGRSSAARWSGLFLLCLALAAPCVGPRALVVAAKPTVPSAQQAAPNGSSQTAVTLKLLREWASAVEQHEPGTYDRHAAVIDNWSYAEVRTFVSDLPGVLKFVTKLGGKVYPLRSESVTSGEIRTALRLTDEEWRAGDVTRMARRAALLHADLGHRGRDSTSAWGSVVGNPRPGPAAGVVNITDGRTGSRGTANGHWRFGRYLLDRVKPGPSRDRVAAAWYRGSAALLLLRGDLADGRSHLSDAREVFPDDAVIAFYEGVLREAYASPLVQVAVQSAQSAGESFRLKSADGELRDARVSLRRAVALDPELAEARLRLGRVLGQLGDHREAAGELQKAIEQTRDPMALYYARLFLGAEQEALGRMEAARESYEAASSTYPAAQAPRLALAQLRWREGDRASARSAILDALSQRGRPNAGGLDPWWSYIVAPGRHATAFFEEAARICIEEERR